ncbi:MAG: type II secretion system protein [Acidobacteriota bacterium]
MDEPNRARGMSLVEIMVVLGVVGIAALVTLPNLIQYQVRARLMNPLRDIERLSSVARLQALNRGSQGVLAFLQDGVTDEFTGQPFSGQNGVVIFLDANNNGLWDGAEPIAGRYAVVDPVAYRRPSGSMPIEATNYRVIFGPTGAIVGGAEATIYLGDERGNFVRLVFNRVTGQVRREKNVPETSDWLGAGREQDWRWLY